MSEVDSIPRAGGDGHLAVPPEPLRIRVTSEATQLASVRKVVEAYAAAAGFKEAAVAELGLVVNEAMANVIRHAYASQPGKPIELEVEPLTDAEASRLVLRVRLRDWGNGLNPKKIPVRGYIPGEPGGLGLVCLGQMMDSAEYTPQPDGMLLTMTKSQALSKR